MTIREIASIAGVSPAAVSLVINNKKGVSDETRRRVQSVIDEYGYAASWQKRKVKRFRSVSYTHLAKEPSGSAPHPWY